MSERPLPMADGQGGGAPESGQTSAGPGQPTGQPPVESGQPPVEVESSSVRLVGTLAVAGALAGLAIVLVFQWAQPRIEAWRAQVLAEAVTEVLAGADRYETVFLDDGAFTAAPAADTSDLDRVYVGYDADGAPVGVAMVGAQAGFQDVIRLIFGFDPDTGEVIGMRVLESKETPGLGDKIEKDSAFVDEFRGVEAPLLGLKSGRETGAATEVTMITGATISSRAVIDIINARLAEVRDPVEALWRGGSLAATAPAEGAVTVAADRADVPPGRAGTATPTPGGSP